MISSKLPADYRIDALAIEADRIAKKTGRPDYSYGKLVADTTEGQRDEIAEDYKRKFRKKKGRGGTESPFPETDAEGAGE